MNKILKIVTLICYLSFVFICTKYIIAKLPVLSEFNYSLIRVFIVLLLFSLIKKSKEVRSNCAKSDKYLLSLAIIHTAMCILLIALYSIWQENAIIDSLLRFFVTNRRVNILILSSVVIINLVISSLFIRQVEKHKIHDHFTMAV